MTIELDEPESTGPDILATARTAPRTAFDEIAAWIDEDLAEDVFFERFLESVVRGLEASGGAVWKNGARNSVRLLCRRNVPEPLTTPGEAALRNGQLVLRVLSGGESMCVPDMQQGSVALAGIKSAGTVAFALELFFDGRVPDDERAGCLAMVERLCNLAGDYLRNRQLRRLQTERATWRQLDQFREAVHATLRTKQVAFAIANEARRLVGCDRVSVAIRRGSRYRVVAISGQDTFDPRAVTVRLLDTLVTVAAVTDEPLWYSGRTDAMPPQVESAVEDYVGKAHSKIIGILPLALAGTEDDKTPSIRKPNEPIAALVIENIEDASSLTEVHDRAELVCTQSTRALSNALEHERLFLLPLWKALGNSRALVEARTLPKTIVAALAVAAIAAVLVFVPFDFDVYATGTLQPVVRREVFAASDGTVDQVLIHHGDRVTRGQLLARMRNTDLDVSITDVTGQIAAAQEQLASVERSLFEEGKRLSVEERNRMSGQRSELRQKLTSLECQLDLLQRKREKLQVTSPITGEMTTWNVDELLYERPVRQGQTLMSVADSAGPWELELCVPEDRMGYVLDAQRALGNDLRVEYRLATDPESDHIGAVDEVHLAAEIRGEEGNTVLVRVKIDKNELSQLQPGAECRAKVHCGKRALGYVLFHDLVAFVHSRVLFRL
jgi:multidrug efflux pump subunit AcrA (membrane-fusion protein)